MRAFRDWSIKTKLILLAVVSAGMALAILAVGITVNQIWTMRAFKMEALQTQAGVLAFNSAGVLSFNDVPAAKQLLSSLKALPSVEFACLYDTKGQVLATYPAEQDGAFPPSPFRQEVCRINANGDVEVFQRVVDRGEDVGSLYLRANTNDLSHQLYAFGVVLAGVVIAGLLLSVLLAGRLQRTISGPILRLGATANQIMLLGDYSIRVEEESTDELGVLCIQFNRMLDRVAASDSALKKAHDELENRVMERTADLREEIDRRERTQKELVEAKNAAEAANVAKSQFLANMSHEIRTPLNAIIGFAYLLRKNAAQCCNVECNDFLQTIHASGEHLLDLINDILDLSKIEADRLEVEEVRCSPHQIIEEVISVLRVRAFEKGLSLDYRWDTGVPETIATDPSRFRQLLMNLVGNAIKFTATGGVQIIAHLVEDQADPQLVIQVVDTGVGIPAEKIEDVFDPFVQADASVTRRFGGTGLGLTISRRIAQALGGDIVACSEMDKGSTFTVSIATGSLAQVAMLALPLIDSTRSEQEGEEGALPSLAGARVLLVEDGDTNRRLIGLVLERAGAEVTTAENGRIGVELALRNPFELVLMDMQMPVMDGYAAAALLRQQGATLPILALTAHAMKGDQGKCLAAGCSGYITKPIDGDRLVRKVAETLRGESAASGGGSVDGAHAPGNVSAGAPAEACHARASAGDVVPEGLTLCSTLPTEDPDFREIVEEFVARLDEQFIAMRRAFEDGDFPELARLAHWLKGAGGTAGFSAFTEPAKHLECLVRGQECEAIEAALAELGRLAQRITVPPARPATACS